MPKSLRTGWLTKSFGFPPMGGGADHHPLANPLTTRQELFQ